MALLFECRRAGLRGGLHEDQPWPIRTTNGSARAHRVSDKTARQEFGLIQDEINDAIDAGTLQYHQTYYTGTRG
jgi:hypothetical protein